ncbi:TPA: hypothetical protein QCY08_001763 [Bacillus paranthracis]|nr:MULTISPECIES: hypothetical protein [Bacillus cereus group]ONG84994.1 hypothetical protein BKK40_28655 [Bacillus cereus]HDR7764819.1 hypothetical protein [Bacillus paranthracis]
MRICTEEHLNSTINDMFNFEDRLKALTLKVYPSNSLRDLVIDDLLPVLQELREKLLIERTELKKQIGWQISSQVKAIVNFWWNGYFQLIVNAISVADLKSSPFEIIEVFRLIISRIDSSEFEIITVPSNDLNFTFRELWQYVKDILQNEVGISNFNRKKFIELTFPNQHKDNVFLSGIYAHEIGHYFDKNKGIWSKIFTDNMFKNKDTFFNEIRPFFEKRNGQPVTEIEIISVLESYVLGHWIREAVADCVAVYLLGPAFMFSFQELLVSLVGRDLIRHDVIVNIGSITHPRNSMRFDFQLSILKDMGLYDFLDVKIKDTLEIIKDDWENATTVYDVRMVGDSNLILHLTNDSYRILEGFWKGCLSEVQKEVSNLIGDNCLTQQHLEEAMNLSKDKLKWLVPPNEISEGVPANVQAIINSGWFTKLLYKDDILNLIQSFENDKKDYEFDNLINRLLKYSLHASNIQERWKE